MALFDTDVLIFHLRGYEAAKRTLSRFGQERNFCSVITAGEILFGMKEAEREQTMTLLNSFEELTVDKELVLLAHDVKLKGRGFQLELYDCIIAATAIKFNQVLVTRNKKHFPDSRLKLYIPDI